MIRLLKNEEIKSITIKFVIIQIIILLGVYIFFTININNLNKRYIGYNNVLADRLIEKYPESSSDIVKVFTDDIGSNEINSSKEALKDYGYTEELLVYKNPIIYSFKNQSILGIVCLLIISGIILYIVIIKSYSDMFSKIKEVSESAEAVVEGDFDRNLPDDREGDFYILGHQFNIMSKRLEESISSLKKEKKYLESILSDISHQLKTPLSSLVMFNDIMLKNQTMAEDERQYFLNMSSEQLNRMEWLIKNLLILARLEAGSVKFKKEKNRLNLTIERAVTPLYMKAKEKNQNIVIDCSGDIIFCHDFEWTAEALINIIKNSIEHSKEKGNIRITSEETPLSVSIYIEDDGNGISKEEIPKIFKRFYKGENSTNPTNIGIGLALSKTIIEGQDGSITVTSKEGEGTKFVISFLKTVV